jgi:hypothetical protein
VQEEVFVSIDNTSAIVFYNVNATYQNTSLEFMYQVQPSQYTLGSV